MTPAELLAALVGLSILLAILALWGRPRLLLPREPEGRVTGWRPRTRVRPGRGPMDWRDL